MTTSYDSYLEKQYDYDREYKEKAQKWVNDNFVWIYFALEQLMKGDV